MAGVSRFADRRWTSPDGLNLFARDYAPGDGPARLPVVAIHGLTRNSADFGVIAPLLAQSGRRVLAVDVRGRGRSDRASDPMTYRPDVYVKDVLVLMDRCGIDRAVFLGTSMGGLVTLVMAGIRPGAVAAAILNDIGPEVSPTALASIIDYISVRPEAISTWAEAAAYIRRYAEAAFPAYTEADWDAFARRIFREGTEGAPVLDYDPDISVPLAAEGTRVLPPLWPQFRRLTKKRPVLLVRGGASQLVTAEIAAKLRKAAPAMAYVEVPGVGHAPMLDEPEARAAIFEFLADVD